MKKALLVFSVLVGLVALPLARADILPPNGGSYPWLPPDTGYSLPLHLGGYVSPAQYHATYDNMVTLNNVFHYGFSQSFAPPTSGTQIHSFGALLEFNGSVNLGGTWTPFYMADVPNTTTVRITFNSPGDYSTEMTGLNVSAATPFGLMMIRESPTLASTGHTTFTAVTGGYQIDSFFDIYTELSLDDGLTWMPDNTGPVHVGYTCIPEPAATSLLGLGVAGLFALYRRSRKA
jgi:hypothetical protein